MGFSCCLRQVCESFGGELEISVGSNGRSVVEGPTCGSFTVVRSCTRDESRRYTYREERRETGVATLREDTNLLKPKQALLSSVPPPPSYNLMERTSWATHFGQRGVFVHCVGAGSFFFSSKQRDSQV